MFFYVFLTNAYNSVCLIFKNVFKKHFYFGVVFFSFVLSFWFCGFVDFVCGFGFGLGVFCVR